MIGIVPHRYGRYPPRISGREDATRDERIVMLGTVTRLRRRAEEVVVRREQARMASSQREGLSTSLTPWMGEEVA